MQNAPSVSAVVGGVLEAALQQLPSPVVIADARTPGFPVLLANAAAAPLLSGGAIVGVSLEEALVTQVAPGQPTLDDLCAAAVASGENSIPAMVQVLAGEPGTPSTAAWSVSVHLLHDGGTPLAVMCTFTPTGVGPVQDAAGRGDALRAMAGELVTERPVAEILRDAVGQAAEVAGARRAVILISDGGDEFTTAAAVGDTDLPRTFAVPSTSEALVDLAWGRTQLIWSADRPSEGGDAAAALPFIGGAGWEQAIVLGTRVLGGGFGLLAVGEPLDGDWDEGALRRLDFAGILIGAAVEGAQLRGKFSRLEELLRGAVTTSAALAGDTDPAQMRQLLLDGIVGDMHLSGAALWVSRTSIQGETGESAVLAASAGLPDDVCQAIATLPANDAVAETAAGRRRWHIPTDATSARAWADHHLHLVAVPEPTLGALGVYSEEPLPGPAEEVFATLAQAYASAVHQSTLHGRARSVIDALQRQLQPHLFELPPGLECGYVYQSATAGVPIGGDFLDVFATSAGHLGIACGDVSGKGIEAATLSAMAVHSLRAFALQGAMPRIVTAMMDAVVEAQTGDDRFLTMIYARIDPREWAVELTVAGHPPPILVGPDGARALDVVADVPVGMLGTAQYAQAAFHLPAGHSLVLYTDGVTEARSEADRSLFGLERLVMTVDGMRDRDATGIAEGIWDEVQEWSAGETMDDCAVIVLRRTAEDGA